MYTPAFLLLLAAGGCLAGLLAGLLGIGGGVLLVPLFLFIFPAYGMPPETVVHAALGTSLAIIIPTAFSSTLGHRRHGNVDWHQVGFLSIGGMLGATLGAAVAALLTGNTLKALFGLMQIAVAFRLLKRGTAPPHDQACYITAWSLIAVGFASGAFSAFFGVGGGVVAVPLMLFILKLPIHRAIGNSSALIVLSASAGALSYVWHGWETSGLPPGALGYVLLPVALIVAPFSILFARFGVRLATAFSRDKLVKIFALLLIFVGIRILYPVINQLF
jgi:uncharacterized membrane protein YfcA